MKYTLHPLETEHKKPIIDIYNYYVRNTFGTYTTKEVGENYFNAYTGFSVRRKSEVVGFAIIRPYLTIHDISYYIHYKHTGRGIGSLILSEVNMRLAVHLASLNEDSLRFHIKHGFTEYGRLKDAGEKFGKVYDIIFMQKNIDNEK